MVQLDDIPKKNLNLASQVIDGEVIALNLEEHCEDEFKLNIFNDTGTIIWELINGKNSIRTIIKKIAAEYEVDPIKAESEIRDFLNDLSKKRLINFSL